MQNQEQCNQLVLDLAQDMACTLGYVEDVEQFTRLGQLKLAIRDVQPLIEDTSNFIVKFTSDGAGVSTLSRVSKIFNCDFVFVFSSSVATFVRNPGANR